MTKIFNMQKKDSSVNSIDYVLKLFVRKSDQSVMLSSFIQSRESAVAKEKFT